MRMLVTGAAGFIGSYVAKELARRGDDVIGIDNINDYYDVRLKCARLKVLLGIEVTGTEMPYETFYQSDLYENLRFIRLPIDNESALNRIFENEQIEVVVNLAAQVGVRYSITNPKVYMRSNFVGFFNILEACRNFNVPKLVFASSSSVYGMNEEVPYQEDDKTDAPVSLYAASKKSNELMAFCYSNLYGFQAIGLRYFTVYGPWGRPDMSPMLFANAIREDEPIKVFNNGDMIRDFTYIDDIVEGTIRVIDHELDGSTGQGVRYRVYNIGCGHPVKLMDFIEEMELAFGKEAKKFFLPMQAGDVYQTSADTSRLKAEIGFKPKWSLHDGIVEFVKWYNSIHNPITKAK